MRIRGWTRGAVGTVAVAAMLAFLSMALLSAALLASPAAADSPVITLDTNHAELPQVAVDSSGNAHMVWNEVMSYPASDVLRYCEIPAGQSACAISHELDPPPPPGGGSTSAFDHPIVLLTSTPGQVVVIQHRCCATYNLPDGTTGDNPDFMWVSNDGGQTFASPQIVGTTGIAGDPSFGPGGFSVSVISDSETGHTSYKAIPLSGYVSGTADVGDLGNGQAAEYHGSVAMVNPTTPIIAEYEIPNGGGPDNVYWREQSGSGNPNDLGTWGPPTLIDHGDEPQLVSGPRGVYLIELESVAGGNAYQVRRFTGSGFGSPTTVSEIGDPVFRDFYEDDGGTLHFVWSDSSSPRALRYSESTDGVSWSAPVTLVANAPANGGFYNPDIGACGSQDGWVVWDANGGSPSGEVFAARIGNGTHCGTPNNPSCPSTLTVGVAQLLSKEGCFTKQADGTYLAPGDVRMNGLDLTPDSSTTHIVVDTVNRLLTASGATHVMAGSLPLDDTPLHWLIPAKPGPLLDSLTGDLAALDAGKAGAKLLGLPIDGVVTPQLGVGTASLPLNVPVPSPIDALGGGAPTSDITLQASEDNPLGLTLSHGGVHIHLDDVFIGPAEIKPFDIDYTSDPNVLDGHVGLILPVIGSKLDTVFTLQNGHFKDLTANLDLASPPSVFAPFGAPLAESIFLRSVTLHGNDFESCAHPADIHGSAVLAGGPTIAGASLIEVDGSVGYQFPRATCQLPGVFYITGTGKLIGLSVANLAVEYKTTGQFTIGAQLHLGDPSIIGIEAGIQGGVDIPSKSFYASGDAALSVAGYKLAHAEVIVSNVGLGGCTTLLPIPNPFNGFKTIQAGFKYVWGGDFTPYLADCDVSDLKPSAFGSSAHAAGAGSFTLPAGLPSAAVVAVGPHAPRLQITGPGGLKATTPPMNGLTGGTARAQIAIFPGLRQTSIRLVHPVPGRYTVTALPGSSISKLLTGNGSPPPKLTATVTGSGTRRVLAYRIQPVAGQRVRFLETGPDTSRLIGTARAARGTIAFAPGAGPAGARTIIALVDQGGFPRARLTVAHYSAPRMLGLPAPAYVRVRRSAGAVLVTFPRVTGARRYIVRAKLRDGRNLLIVTRSTRVRIGSLAGFDSGRVTVASLDASNVPSAFTAASVPAKPVTCPKHQRRVKGRCRKR